MSLAADKKRWDELHAALAKATEAKDEFDRQLHSHYGRYEDQWLTKTQRAKLATLRAKEDKIGEKIFELVERISPRRWDYGVASWWVRRELTWEDAIRPKGEPLSVVVPGSWGSPDGTVKERTSAVRLTPMEQKVLIAIARSEYQHGTGADLIGTYVYSRGIADDAGIARRSAAGVFSSLSKKGLVNTAVHDEDVVALTAAGVEALPKRLEEAQMLRTNSFPRKNIPSHRRPAHGAEERGEQYAREQIDSDYFMDWVRDQMLEASKADPSEMLPLKTKADAMVIAKNMLRQLEWDTQRELRGQELADLIGASSTSHADIKEFFNGFREACDGSRDWLADELLTIKGEMGGGGVGEARTVNAKSKSAHKYYIVEQVQNGLWVQVGHFYWKSEAERFQAKLGGKTRIVRSFPGAHDHPPITEESRRPKARRSVRHRA